MQIKLTFIQPLPPADPISPVFINPDYTISWADYTGTDPLSLVGFVVSNSTATKELLDLDNETFWDNAALATNKFVVFKNIDDEWVGTENRIELVEIIEPEE